MKLEEYCDICGNNTYSRIFSKTTKYSYDLMRCEQCQLVTIYPKPSEKKVVSFYNTSLEERATVPDKDFKKAATKIKRVKGIMGACVLSSRGYNNKQKAAPHWRVLGFLLKHFITSVPILVK